MSKSKIVVDFVEVRYLMWLGKYATETELSENRISVSTNEVSLS